MYPVPCLPGLAGTREGVGPSTLEAKEARLQERGVVEARPCLSGFIRRAVMNPLGQSSPHALHSRLLLVQRETFDSHRQLSDGTKSLHTPLVLPLSAFTSLLSSFPPDYFALPQPFLLFSKKIQQPERAPSIGSSHQEKRITILWAGPAKRKGRKKGRFALLIEKTEEKGGSQREREGE